MRRTLLRAALIAACCLATPSAAAIAAEGAARLRPAPVGAARIVREPRLGVISLQSAPLRLIVAEAFDVHPLDLHFDPDDPGLDPDALFEGRVVAPGDGLAAARLALRAALANDLALELELRERRQPVRVLELRDAWLVPSQSRRPLHQPLPGRLVARRQPIAALIRFLRWHSQVPILDETGLDADYDFVLEWDRSAQPLSLWLALEDLGLRLEVDERTLEEVTVRRASPPSSGADR